MRLLAIVVALAGTLGFAQAPAPRTQEPISTVSGSVRDADTGEPIVLARVSLRRGGQDERQPAEAVALTGTEGEFRFENAPSGSYRLQVSGSGYIPAVPDNVPSYFPVPTRDASAVEHALTLRKEAVIQGKVLDAQGAPIEGEVLVQRLGLKNGRDQVVGANRTTLWPDGSFRVAQLAPGYYRLMFFSPPGGSFHKITYAEQVYPQGTRLDAAYIFELPPGRHETVDFRPTPMPAFTIRGTLPPSPGAGVSMWLADPANDVAPVNAQALSWSATGGFHVTGLHAGRYVIQSWDNGPRYAFVDVASDADNVHPALHPMPTVPCVIRFEAAANPVPLVHVHVLNLYTLNAASYDAKGSIDLPSTQPGASRIWVDVPQPWYVDSIRQKGRDLSQEPFVLTGNAPDPIEIVLATGSAQVYLTASPTLPIRSSVNVALLRKGAAGSEWNYGILYGSAATESAPKTWIAPRMDDLAPGEYSVVAWTGGADKIDHLPYAMPEFAQKYGGFIQHVTLTPGITHVAIEQLLPAEAFRKY